MIAWRKKGKNKQKPKGQGMSQHHSSIHTALQRITGEERGEVGRGGGGGTGQLSTTRREKGREGVEGGVSVTYQLWYYVEHHNITY